MRVFILIALRNLWQAPRRTLLLGVAIATVTSLLVLLMALSQGILDNVVRSATTLSAGHVNVSGFFKATTTDAAPILTEAPKIRKIVEANTPGLDYVIARHRGWAKVVSPTGSLQAGISGVAIAEERHLLDVVQLALESEYKEGGRAVPAGDPGRLKEPNSAMIFASQAKRLGVTVGDSLTLRTETMQGVTNTGDVTVVAVARDVGLLSNFSIFVPTTKVLELYGMAPDTTGAIQIYLKDIGEAPAVMGHLRTLLAKEGYEVMDHQPVPFFAKFDQVSGEDWVGQKLDLTIWSDEVSFLTWIVTALDVISFTLVAILIIIIAVGITNTTWISVRERTREIGTVRAIGTTSRQILLMFLLEAKFLGLGASILGALMGALIATAINAAKFQIPIDAVRAILLSDTLYLSVLMRHMATASISLTVFTMLAALWPAMRASRMQPVQAIQSAE